MSKLSLSRSNLVVANHQIHYAWVIVGVASVMWITSSTIRFAISLLVPQLQDPSGPFGWSYFSIASAFTLQWVLSGVLSPGAGWLGDRYGVRKIMLAGAGLFVAGMLLTGAMSELWEFLLYFGVLMGAAMAIFQVSLITGVSLWFKKNLGLAMGLLQGFQGLGTVLAIVMVYVLFAWLGWRWTFWIPGVAWRVHSASTHRFLPQRAGRYRVEAAGRGRSGAGTKTAKQRAIENQDGDILEARP